MIKAYLAGFTSPLEGEDIEIRYSIYEDQDLLNRQSILLEYQKPALVGLVSLSHLMQELKSQIGKEIVILINDPALYELIRGTSTTKNREQLKMVMEVTKEFMKFDGMILKDVSQDHEELLKWNAAL